MEKCQTRTTYEVNKIENTSFKNPYWELLYFCYVYLIFNCSLFLSQIIVCLSQDTQAIFANRNLLEHGTFSLLFS